MMEGGLALQGGAGTRGNCLAKQGELKRLGLPYRERYRWLLIPLLVFLLTRSLVYAGGYVGRVAFVEKIGNGPWHTHSGNVYHRWVYPLAGNFNDAFC